MALMLAGADGKSSAVVQYTALLLQNYQYELYKFFYKKMKGQHSSLLPIQIFYVISSFIPLASAIKRVLTVEKE